MKRRWSFAPWGLVVLVVAGYACEPERRERVYLQDFEGELCDGVPCGWERTTGTPEQATWSETIHPGEHALRLSGDVTVRGPGTPEVIPGPNILLRMAVRCDPGSNLSVDVVVTDELGTRALSVDPFAQDEWDEVSVTLGGRGEIESSTIAAVVLAKRGPGVCEVGEVMIDDVLFGDDIVC